MRIIIDNTEGASNWQMDLHKISVKSARLFECKQKVIGVGLKEWKGKTHHIDVVCIVHHPTVGIWTNKMHKILVIRLYFPLDALHVSDWGPAVAQLVEALRYKSEGRGFDSRCCHWNFSLT